MAITIKNNLHLPTGQETHWVVSIRWRSQSDVYKATEWLDIADTSLNCQRLYDDWQTTNITAEPLLRSISNIPQKFEVGSEGQVSFEVDRNRTLDSNSALTIESFFDDTYPAEYADVFISLVLGEPSDRTTEIMWAGAIESFKVTDELVAFTAVDQTRKLMVPLTERVNKDDYPNASNSLVGEYKPFAVGEISEFPGILIEEQYYTSLSSEVDIADTSVEVSSSENFPDAGKAIINSEVISYTSKTDTALYGVTRGQTDWNLTSTSASNHPSGSLCFAATQATVNGQTVFGPVFLLTGKPLPGGMVHDVRAHDNSATYSVGYEGIDYISEMDATGGAIVGLTRTYPRILEEGDSGSWYAVEFDSEGPLNQANDWAKAAGANYGFAENEFVLVSQNSQLALKRVAGVEAFGPDIKKVYLLVEYANIHNPSGVATDGHYSIPGNSFDVYHTPVGGQEAYLGRIDSEQDALPDDVFDPSKVIQARPLGSNHTHGLSAGGGSSSNNTVGSIDLNSKTFWKFTGWQGTGGGQSSNFSGEPVNSIPGSFWLGNNQLSPLGGQTAVSTVDAGGPGCSNLDGSGTYNYHKATKVWFGWSDEAWLPYAFYHLDSISMIVEASSHNKFTYNTGSGFPTSIRMCYVEDTQGSTVDTVDAFRSGGWQGNQGSNESFTKTLEKDYTGIGTRYFVGQKLPFKGYFQSVNNGENLGLAEVFMTNYLGPLRVQMSPTTSKASIVLSNGTADVWDTGPGSYGAPTDDNSPVSRIMSISGSSGGNLMLASGVNLGNFNNHVLTPNPSVTVKDLNGCTTSQWHSRLVVEVEGDIGIADIEPARTSSLKAFDITTHVADWGELSGGIATVKSPTSTGSFSPPGSGQLNNDSAWVVRLSYLIQASSSGRNTVDTVSASFRALQGTNAAGTNSRKAGDIAYKILTDSALLNIGGDDYFTGGWAKSTTFHSDEDGPAFLANGATYDTADPATYLSDLASQAEHSLYWERGRLKMKEILTSGFPSAVKTLTEAELTRPVQSSRRPAETIVNKVLVEYDQDYVRRGFKETYESVDSDSEGKFGERRDEALAMGANDKYSGDGVTADTQATSLGDSVAARFAEPSTVVSFTTTLAGTDLELGDIVGITTTGFTAGKVEITGMTFKPGKNNLDEINFEGIVRT